MESEINSTRKIGIEIEFVAPIIGRGNNHDVQELLAQVLTNHGIQSCSRGYTQNALPRGYQLAVEHDASLHDESKYRGLSWSKLEVKTAPLCWDEIERVLPPALALIRYIGARINASCGLHVHHHLPEAEHKPQVVRNLQHLWWRLHRVMYGMVAPSRLTNMYCRPPQRDDATMFDNCVIDPDHKFAWGENIGWTNWRHETPNPGDGIFVGDSFLAGFVWAKNVGWINLGDGVPADGTHYTNIDASEFGVNIDLETGNLFGLAWSENVGWINFDTSSLEANQGRFDVCEHRFLGFAWGENIGWINLDDETKFVAVGPCEVGDVDCDGSVMLDDYSRLQSELAGPDTPASCSALDADDDGDLDLRDVAAFQIVFGEVR